MPKILNSIDVDEHKRQKKVTAIEAILNWQFENALAHNSVLKLIGTELITIQTNLDHVDKKVD